MLIAVLERAVATEAVCLASQRIDAALEQGIPTRNGIHGSPSDGERKRNRDSGGGRMPVDGEPGKGMYVTRFR